MVEEDIGDTSIVNVVVLRVKTGFDTVVDVLVVFFLGVVGLGVVVVVVVVLVEVDVGFLLVEGGLSVVGWRVGLVAVTVFKIVVVLVVVIFLRATEGVGLLVVVVVEVVVVEVVVVEVVVGVVVSAISFCVCGGATELFE